MQQPLLLSPCFQHYLWGGTALSKCFAKHSECAVIAESWEISVHPTALSTIQAGALQGITLKDYLEKNPCAMGNADRKFPILVKFIDANQPLSVQVHPNDTYAQTHEGQTGKNEMWYVIDCAPGAELVLGLKQSLSKQKLRQAIQTDTLLPYLNRVSVSPGDCFLIPAGLIHAIGAGILIAEVQQSSDVTYRVYDYHRIDKDGKQRPLHIDQAIETIDPSLQAIRCVDSLCARRDSPNHKLLCDWTYFQVDLLQIDDDHPLSLTAPSHQFQSLVVLKGTAYLNHHQQIILPAGQSVFIPAGIGAYELTGAASMLLITA